MFVIKLTCEIDLISCTIDYHSIVFMSLFGNCYVFNHAFDILPKNNPGPFLVLILIMVIQGLKRNTPPPLKFVLIW